MKNRIQLAVLFLFLSLSVMAQENIHFVAGTPAQEGISDKVKDAMRLKVEQILARNNAGATSLYNAFVIEPELTIIDTRSTEGLVRDVTLVTGEFSLTAKNRYDESIYGNVIIEVSGDATGNEEAAIASLLNSIKSNNPAFLRFIRTTRQRIVEHYEQNCETIVRKAQTMINMQQYEEAMAYLSSVPEVVSCYVEATQLLETSFSAAQVAGCDKQLRTARGKYILRDYQGALDILKEIPSNSPCGDDALALIDSIAKNIVFKDETGIIPESELIDYDPQTSPDVNEESSGHTISTSCNHIQFELVSCEGNAVSQIITLYGRLENTGAKMNATIFMETVIAPDGSTLRNFVNSGAFGASPNRYGNAMPTGVKLAKAFEIRDVVNKHETLSYVELYVDGCKVIIRDLPVEWK